MSRCSAVCLGCGENREPGVIPGRYRRCMCGYSCLLAKASHWETGKAKQVLGFFRLHESEELPNLVPLGT